MPGCHAGPDAAKGLRLEASHIYRSAVNVRAKTDPRFLRVNPGSPDQSLLYLKLLPPEQGHYRGPRMPFSMGPLRDEQIEMVRAWIASFPVEEWGEAPVREAAETAPRAFYDTFLVNLPTPAPLGNNTLEFRILHRFRPSAQEAGGRELYGLDGGAWISFGLAYGLTDKISLGLRRTNLLRDYEAYAQWTMLTQGVGHVPFWLALRGSASSVREDGRVNRTRYGAQAVFARRFGPRLSLMAVPTYVTHTNHEDPDDDRATGGVGLGGELHLSHRFAVAGEWMIQTSGVRARYQGASLGFGIATARHTFYLVATNTPGTHTDLYAPGGDLDIEDTDFRLGFNISRTFRPK